MSVRLTSFIFVDTSSQTHSLITVTLSGLFGFEAGAREDDAWLGGCMRTDATEFGDDFRATRFVTNFLGAIFSEVASRLTPGKMMSSSAMKKRPASKEKTRRVLL